MDRQEDVKTNRKGDGETDRKGDGENIGRDEETR